VVGSKDSGSGYRIPANFSCVYSASQIAARVKEIGAEVSYWCKRVYNDTQTEVLVVPVLRGAMIFFADLIREISMSVEVIPVRASVDQSTGRTARMSDVAVDLSELVVKGRVVLIVDDVSDSGSTFDVLESRIEKMGVKEVRTAVLVRRLLNAPSYVPCWVGFNYSGSERFVGYGMDDNERWRNLPGVYVIKKDR
jgi:hypoxanthine phosphoribosyltransferase